MTDIRHPDPDELVDLALGQVDEPARSELLTHVAACTGCSEQYGDMLDAVDTALVTGPVLPPPPGFDARTLEAIGPAHARRRMPRRTALAAAAALVVAAGLGGFAIRSATQPEVTPGPDAAVLRTGDGREVGTATPTRLDGRDVVVVQIDRPVKGVAYSCRFVREDGSTVVAARWMPSPPGALWVVEPPPGSHRLELVTDSGAVWSTTTW